MLITRGLASTTLVTRGYSGTTVTERMVREVVRLASFLRTEIKKVSKIWR